MPYTIERHDVMHLLITKMRDVNTKVNMAILLEE